ncbi:hypothetical protein AAKU64_003603 [Undibacterium sp. GrIS 1.8]
MNLKADMDGVVILSIAILIISSVIHQLFV